jgi:hypothetical protein
MTGSTRRRARGDGYAVLQTAKHAGGLEGILIEENAQLRELVRHLRTRLARLTSVPASASLNPLAEDISEADHDNRVG